MDRVYDTVEGPLGAANAFYKANQELLASTARNLMSVDIDPKALEQAISGFAETAQAVMKGLSLLSEVHPFIAG